MVVGRARDNVRPWSRETPHSLINLAQIERLSPETLEALIGACDFGMRFAMQTPEGDANLTRVIVHCEDDNFHYVLAYMRELAGNGFWSS